MNYRWMILAAVMLTGLYGSAQLDDYKYIIVPRKFDAFKHPNQHQTSTLIKHLFTQAGFTTLYDDIYPDDLAKNPCLGATVALQDESSLFSTKVQLALKDCKGRLVYEALEARSKEKDWKSSYKEAITTSFEPLAVMDYAYKPKSEEAKTVTVSMDKDVQTVPTPPATPETAPAKEIVVAEANTPQAVDKDTEKVEQSKVDPPASEPASQLESSTAMQPEEVLYAQPIENGYQLVDKTPKIKLKLLNTSREGEFVAITPEGTQGVVYKSGNAWWYERYEAGKLVREPLLIKF